MRGKTKLILAGLMVLSLLVVPLLSACTVEQPAEKTITVGFVQDFSGPTAQASGRLFACAQEFIKWANETNIVPGVTVSWATADDKYDASQVALAYQTIKTSNPDVIFTMTAVSSSGLKPFVDEDKIPVLSFTGSVATAQEPVGYVFQLTFVPEINFNCFLNYVADTWTETRPCKVASLSWDDNDGTQHINSGIATAAALGIDFKREYAEIAPPGTGLGAGSFASYVTRLKELDPDYIFFPMIGPATGVALNEMIAQGMDPKKAVYIVMSGGGMYQDLTAVLGSEEPTHGATLVMADYAWSIQTPEQQQLKSFMEPTTYGWDARYHVNALSYYTSCQVLYEALRIAKEDVGVENINSAAIYNALQKIENFDTGVCLPVTFGTNDRLGVQSTYIYEIGTDSIPHLKTDKIYTWPQGHEINPAYPSE